MSAKLKPRQEAFAREWVKDFNGQEAYKRAGYKVKSNEVAQVGASKLLSEPKVQELVQKLLGKAAEKAGLSLAWVLERLQVESVREGDGSSHGARVSALKELKDYLAPPKLQVRHEGEVTYKTYGFDPQITPPEEQPLPAERGLPAPVE